jgi:hypothetical protein
MRWGYDAGFMALMPAALGASEDIAAGDVWIAFSADGQIVGVVALGDAPGISPGRPIV